MRQTKLSHEIVEFIPDRLYDDVLYVSFRYRTAVHKCCCGCGEEVVTPLNPTDWSIRIEEGLVTLHPSIGNWSFACRSHYWIRKSRVVWAGGMSQERIEQGREYDRRNKDAYFAAQNSKKELPPHFLATMWKTFKRWWNS